MTKVHFTHKKPECSSCRCRDIYISRLSPLVQGRDVEPVTPLGRLLWRLMDHTGGARTPPNLALLDGFVMTVRLGKESWDTANQRGSPGKSFFCQQGTTETSRGAGECTGRNSAEGQPQGRGLASPRWPWLPPLLARGALLFTPWGGGRRAACPRGSITPSRGGGEGAPSRASPSRPGRRGHRADAEAGLWGLLLFLCTLAPASTGAWVNPCSFLWSQRSSAEDNTCLLRRGAIPALVGRCKNEISWSRRISDSAPMSVLCPGR